MTGLEIALYVLFGPLIMLSVLGVFGVVYASWIFLLAVFGNHWAQEKWRGF